LADFSALTGFSTFVAFASFFFFFSLSDSESLESLSDDDELSGSDELELSESELESEQAANQLRKLANALIRTLNVAKSPASPKEGENEAVKKQMGAKFDMAIEKISKSE
jgi:hypothetical protein